MTEPREADATTGAAPQAERLRRLLQVAIQLTSTLNLDDLLTAIMAAATDLLEVESSALLLHDEDTGDLEFRISTDNQALVGQRVPPGQGVAGATFATREPIVVTDAAADPRLYRQVDEALGQQTRDLLAVPLVVRDRAIGVIEAINRRSAPFADDDVEFATALASLAAIAIDNATMYARLADAVVAARMSYRL